MSEKTLSLARMEARFWTIFNICQDIRGDIEGISDPALVRNLKLIDTLAARSYARVSELIRREKRGEA